MADSLTPDQKLCPECGEPALHRSEGLACCSNCGWCEEDDGTMYDTEHSELQ